MATHARAPRGPAHLVLSASVARRFYLDGRSKADIAAQLGLSRFKVARLLDDARATGLVRISVDVPGALDVDPASATPPSNPCATSLDHPADRATSTTPPWSCPT